MGARSGRSTAGYIILENVVAIVIITLVGLSLLAMLQRSMAAVVKARELGACSRAVQTAFSRLRNIDFYTLFSSDSAAPDHGLWAAYPHKTTLDGLSATLSGQSFDRYTVAVEFLRRDSSDANADGLTSDLVAYRDADGDGADDLDPGVRYFDQNGDGDHYDTYTSGGRTVAEEPDTHIKRVTVSVHRRGRRVCSQTELISLEQATGDIDPSSEAALRILVSTPTNGAMLHSRSAAWQAASQALSISSGLPSEPLRLRADALSPLTVAGETDPLASVEVYVGASAVLATLPADAFGAFAGVPAAVTAALVEGANTLTLRAVKDGYRSPLTERTVTLDLAPPTVSAPSPTGTTASYSPAVSVRVADAGLATTTTSGVCLESLSLRVNGVAVQAAYSAASSSLSWVESDGGPPTLSSGTYTVVAEAADYAGYKSSFSWTFTVSVPATDHSAPSIADRSPVGMAASAWPEVSVRVFDNQSGIDPDSVTLTLDGAVVVDAANSAEHFDPATGVVRYTAPASFAPGSVHTVEVRASHWATSPADKVESSDSWSFTTP